MKRSIDAKPGEWRTLPDQGGQPETQHRFEEDAILALNAALATGRPLLVRGEPGTGKSQLARAAADALGAALIVHVVDARTEIEDLFWRYDAVRRLADAQLPPGERPDLAEVNYIVPEALWWTFDWSTAADQAKAVRAAPPASPRGWIPKNGPRVLLLDEIDKADESLPNGLLAALGSGFFAVRGRANVTWDATDPPLVLVTTNEERPLPDAFLRRCLVLHLALPTDAEELAAWLVDRGGRHVPAAQPSVLAEAARMLVEDRGIIAGKGLCPPGQAEYLDLVRAVCELRSKEKERKQLLEDLRGFTLWKHEPRPGDAVASR